MNRRGFTLMEVIIVLALMGILMAMATPSMIAWRESARNKEVAREILAGLRQARSIAVTENRDIIVSLNTNTNQLTINGNVRQLAQSVPIQAKTVGTAGWDDDDLVSPAVVTFLPQGNSTNLISVRVNQNDRLVVEIDSVASGLARIN